MYRKIVTSMYVFNVLFQSLFNLATPILLMLGLSWLLVTKCASPTWLYAVLGVFGALTGFASMIKFVLRAASELERLEKERCATDNDKKTKPNGEDHAGQKNNV